MTALTSQDTGAVQAAVNDWNPSGVHARVEECQDCGVLLSLLDSTWVTLRQLCETMVLLRYLGICIPVAKPS